MTNQLDSNTQAVASMQKPEIGRDTKVMMAFQNQKKSTGVAYLLWFFFGMLGGHRFYAGQTGTAIAQLILTVTIVGMIVSGVWVLIDAFLIPGMLRKKNDEIMQMLSM